MDKLDEKNELNHCTKETEKRFKRKYVKRCVCVMLSYTVIYSLFFTTLYLIGFHFVEGNVSIIDFLLAILTMTILTVSLFYVNSLIVSCLLKNACDDESYRG